MTVTETAQALIGIPSVNPSYDPASPGEAGMVEWLEQWARQHGIAAEVTEVLPGRSNIVFTLKTEALGPHLLLAAHTDTVAVTGMTVPPFDARIDTGHLQGRGSADMKGPLAALLHALLALDRDRTSWEGTITLACVIDEEYLGRGIKALLKKSRHFDFAIVTEPTSLKVIRGCKGCLRFSFEAKGKAAHSSAPDLGRSAIVAMSGSILELDRFFREELSRFGTPTFGPSTGSVGLINGGTGINIVPESCRASVDIRLIPGQAGENFYLDLQTRIREVGKRWPDITWHFDASPFADPAFEISEKADLVQIAARLQGRGPAEVVAYSCDASKIAEADIPCIILGPGDIAQAHTAAESIPVRELEESVACYAELVRQLLPAC